MRIVVTGGAGFIGSHVAERLVAFGHDVTVIDDLSGGYRRNVPAGADLVEASLVTSPILIADVVRGADAVVHCAAYAAEGLSHWMRRYCYTENLVGWANLANAVVAGEVPRVVVLSSMAVYGDQEPPFTEVMSPRPVDPYGAAKAALEADVRALGELHGVEWVVFRPHNVYGPRQNLADPYRNVVGIFMRQALAGDPITVYGDGQQRRAFSYIDDVADIIALETVNGLNGETVNVGGLYPTTIADLARMVKHVTGSASEIVHLPERVEVRDAWCDHTKLLALFRPPRWELEPGLRHMADWARTVTPGPRRRYDYETTTRLFEPWRNQ